MKPFSVAQLAGHWQCSDTFIYNLVNAGELAAFRLGGKLIRIRPAAVADYEDRVNPQGDAAAEAEPMPDDNTVMRLHRLGRG